MPDSYEAPHACYALAVNYLSRREYSRRELQQKLHDKACNNTEALLEHLQNTGLQSDERFTESIIRSRLRRGQGSKKILHELQQHDIDPNIAQQILQLQLVELNIDWIELASQQREKRFGQAIPSDFKEKMKQSRYLQGRGFDYDIIQAVFGQSS